MEIRDPSSGQTFANVDVGLTAAEALELRDVLDDLLAAPLRADRHEHVSSADYQVEITVWLREDEVDPTA